MQGSQGSAAVPGSPDARPNRRVHYRHQIQSLVYVNMDQGNGAIIRNLSQDGAAIQAVATLQQDQVFRVRFDLLSPKTRVDVNAQVTWCSKSGQAGLRFVDMAAQTRRQLNDWIFLNVLRRIEQLFPAMLWPRDGADLVLSTLGRPPIRLPQNVTPVPSEATGYWLLHFWKQPLSARNMARLMDGLVLFSAVMMFLLVFLMVAQSLPSWPITVGLAIGVCGFFAALYHYLFAAVGCGTAGIRWAKLAIEEDEVGLLVSDSETRFR